MANLEDDLALAARMQSGDPEALEAFVSRYRPKIVWLAQWKGVLPDDCADVAQEVLASAISQIERRIYRGKARLGTWLEPIIRGKVAEYRRASERRLISVSRPADVVPGEQLSKVPKELVSLPEQEIRVLVREVLQSLSAQHRAVLILNKVGNLTIAQISQRLGWPKGTVGRLLAEAQKLFRRGIAGREEFPACTRPRIGSGEE